MSRSYKIISLLAIGAVAAGLYFQTQIVRFLFHPEGLSTASAELCLINKTQQSLIADIKVNNGARTVTFLAPDEPACSAAPQTNLPGTIKVSIQENEPPFCLLEVKSAKHVQLDKFAAPDNCEWSS